MTHRNKILGCAIAVYVPPTDMGPSTEPSNFDGGTNFDWQNYLTHRPQYSASFYDVIWEYHRCHSNRWSLAHDVGTGPGNVAKVLAGCFTNVVATDPSEYHVAVARRFCEERNITVEQCRAEDLASSVGRNSQGKVDLITIAQTLPLLDAKQAFSQCAKLLASGGTFAVWFHGGPIFVEEGQRKSQEIYDRLTGKTYVERTLPWKSTPMERACNVLASWTDNVALPSNDWEDVRRIKWNSDRPLNFFGYEYLDFEPDYESAVGLEEKVEERFDRNLWLQEGRDIAWVKGFVEAQWPWERAVSKEAGEELERMYEDLETAMGGKTGKVKIGWPVSLLLATRK